MAFANLIAADLLGANLEGANLSGANLGANIAKLTPAAKYPFKTLPDKGLSVCFFPTASSFSRSLLVNQQPLIHIQAESPVRVDVPPN
ncbi:MAG TPA: pentapeptide repeat-containing protein [Chroococcales cyanobacterium]